MTDQHGSGNTQLLRQIVPVAALAGLVWLAFALSPVLVPFAAAAVLAYICTPLVDRMEARGVSRNLGSLVTIVLMFLAFVGLLLVVVPLFQEQAERLAERAPLVLRYAAETFVPWLNTTFGTQISIDLASLTEMARQHAESLRGLLGRAFALLSQRGADLAGLFGLLLLVPVVMFYLLADWPRIVFNIAALAPRRWRTQVDGISSEVDHVLGEFLRGQLSVMLSLAVFYCVALKLAGIEHAIALGLITGLLIFIPYVGFGLGLLLALLSAFLQGGGWPPILWVAGIFTAGQLIESFVLTPRLVGERIGLHPVTVIFALLVFGQLLGFLGVLIALPVSAALLVAGRHAMSAYRDSDFFQRP